MGLLLLGAPAVGSWLLPDYWNIFYLVCSISADINKPFLRLPAIPADVRGHRVDVDCKPEWDAAMQ
jgi:hypothetical protein